MLRKYLLLNEFYACRLYKPLARAISSHSLVRNSFQKRRQTRLKKKKKKLSREEKAETGSGHIWGQSWAVIAEADGGNGWWLLLAAGLRVPLRPHVFLCLSCCVSSLGLLWPLGEMDFSHRENMQEIGPSDIYKSDLIPALGSLPGPRSCGNSSSPLRTSLAQFPASVPPLTYPPPCPVECVSSLRLQALPLLLPPSRMPSFQHPHPCGSFSSLPSPPGSLLLHPHPASCGGSNCTSQDACPACPRVGPDPTETGQLAENDGVCLNFPCWPICSSKAASTANTTSRCSLLHAVAPAVRGVQHTWVGQVDLSTSAPP